MKTQIFGEYLTSILENSKNKINREKNAECQILTEKETNGYETTKVGRRLNRNRQT